MTNSPLKISPLKLSVVIPVYNELQNIQPMCDALKAALSSANGEANIDYETIFVDDGSSDGTQAQIKKIAGEAPDLKIKLIEFARNFGQTSAMAAGIDHAEGEYLAFLDGDLQNDPTDIPMMIQKLEAEGLDMVAGRRLKRKDGLFLRKIPSKIANRLIYKVSKLQINDYGCSLKLMKTALAKQLDLYGELHRFIPILADIKGAKIAQVDVKHHARQFGTSKYGIGRTLKVASDLMLMAFFIRYRQKPMHLFGGLGLSALAIGGLIEFYLLALKILGQDIGGRPLFFVGIVLILAGVQLITTGFLAELLMRTYFSADSTKPYRVANVFKNWE
jgi:glycosyltransferase involved in cell wall biosynthesis